MKRTALSGSPIETRLRGHNPGRLLDINRPVRLRPGPSPPPHPLPKSASTTPRPNGSDIIIIAPSVVVRQRVSQCLGAYVDSPRDVALLRTYADRQTNFEIWKRSRRQ